MECLCVSGVVVCKRWLEGYAWEAEGLSLLSVCILGIAFCVISFLFVSVSKVIPIPFLSHLPRYTAYQSTCSLTPPESHHFYLISPLPSSSITCLTARSCLGWFWLVLEPGR
jgi:hypothetical protein